MIQPYLRSRPFNAVRALVQDLLVVPALRGYCAPYSTHRPPTLDARRPVVIVANHASHLDAPAVLAALPHDMRHRTAVAAADDYFYRQRVLGFAISLGIGAFPFPRKGVVGLERAAELLDAGWNILIFPEGTRSSDGALHTFRHGVGRLVAESRAACRWHRRRPCAVAAHQQAAAARPTAVTLGQPWQPPTTDSPAAICASFGAAWPT